MIASAKVSGDLSELRAFGRAADQLQRHQIGVGGAIILPRGHHFRSEVYDEQGNEEAGSPEPRPRWGEGSRPGPWPWTGSGSRPRPGTRQRPSTPIHGSGPHTLERGLAHALKLEELLGHFPGWEWSSVSSRFGTLILPVRPFRSLPYQGTLIVEVPTVWPEWLFTTELRRLSAPHLRAWAYWEYGVQVRAHHEYPDKSICAHKPGEWRLGRDRILAYASFCVLWMAKALHLQLLGRWPGLQHYPAHVRVRRAAYDEFCGCGAKARYGSCHRAFDEARTPADRAWELYLAERAYLHEIRMRGWPPSPPIIQAPST